MKWRSAVLLVTIVAACTGDKTQPPFEAEAATYHATVFPAPAIYAVWWDSTQTCLGLEPRLSFDLTIRWAEASVIPEALFQQHCTDGVVGMMLIWGCYDQRDHAVWLITSNRLNRAVVMHETVHWWQQEVGQSIGHPQNLFDGRCGILATKDS